MTLNEIVRAGARLLQINLLRTADVLGVTAVEFIFEGQLTMYLISNENDDSLNWELARPNDLIAVPLNEKLSIHSNLPVLWFWEMTNQQGYFDAFQIELWDSESKRQHILQFKVAASNINIYECYQL